MPRVDWQNLAATRLLTDEGLQDAWDALNAARSDLPILACYAIAAALRAFGQGDERLMIGQDGNRTVAMFVLRRGSAGRWHMFQPSQLPLGAWVARPEFALQDLARQLVCGPLGPSLVLSITQVDPLYAPRPEDGAAWDPGDYVETGWIDITGRFEDYWSHRSKNLRSSLRKQRSKLEAEGIRPRMLQFMDAAEMTDAVVRYGAMESTGWKAGSGTAIAAENEQGRFYRELLERAAARGEARVFEYRFDDRVAASNLCLQRHGTLIVLKTTYDESIDKTFSPAFLLRQEQLERFFATGECRRLEYYGRFREWHARWTENKRMLYHLTVYRWPWLKALRRLRRRTPERNTEPAA